MIQHYGDCEVCKIRWFHADPVDKIEFIGGSRFLIQIDDEIDRETLNLYQMAEQHRNADRKKAWLKDCEGD